MQAREALNVAARSLPADTARLDAELLMAHLMGVSRNDLLLRHLDRDIDPEAYARLCDRRRRGEPVAYIVGTRSFWTFDLKVTPSVLIPRPDSEILVEAALAALPADRPLRILDLGTGSGALLLAVLSERPAAWGVGVDRSVAALAVARENAEKLGLASRAAFLCSDWGQAIDARFDCIMCNPPYVESGAPLDAGVRDHEPASALFAGADGLDDYRRLIPELPHLLAADGLCCLEIGWQQAKSVSAIARTAGMQVAVKQDLAGRDRCLVLRKSC